MCMDMDIIHRTWWVEKKLRMAAVHSWGWVMFPRSETELGGRPRGRELRVWMGSGRWGLWPAVNNDVRRSLQCGSNWAGLELEERKPAQVSRKPSVRAGSPYHGVCMLCLEIWLLVNYLYFVFSLPFCSSGKLSEVPVLSVLSPTNMY